MPDGHGCGLDGVSTVLNQFKIVLSRNLQDRIHLATAAVHVNHDQRLGPGRDSALDQRRIDIHRRPFAVHKNWRAPGVNDCVDCRAKCHRRRDDFIACSNSERQQRQMERCTATADRRLVRRLLVSRELLLQLPQADPATADALHHQGMKRLLRAGSSWWLARAPFVHLWRMVGRKLRQPYWKKS